MRRNAVASLALVGAAVVLTVVLLRVAHVTAPGSHERPNASAPTAVPKTTASVPTLAPPAAGPEVVTRHSSVTLPWDAKPTPEPTEIEADEAPTPQRGPALTPAVAECVAIRWSSGMSPVDIGHVMVEVHAENRCGRDLDAMEVWFEVAGYRHGELIQTARGHLFDPLWRDGEGKAMIGLPGSADWYDRVDVRVAAAGGM